MMERTAKTLPKRVERVKVIQVIDVTSLEGGGTEADPFRLVHSYWTSEGKLLAVAEEGKDD